MKEIPFILSLNNKVTIPLARSYKINIDLFNSDWLFNHQIEL